MAVDIGELVHIEPGRGLADTVEAEPRHCILAADDFFVPVAPSEAKQVVHHGVREETHITIGVNAERPVPLRQFRAVGAMDQRDMGKDRHIPPHAPIDHGLPEGVVQVIIAANDMGNAHVMVIDNHGEHVGRAAVGAQDHHIVELRVLHGHASLHGVLDGHDAVIRHLHANDKSRIGPVCPVTPG